MFRGLYTATTSMVLQKQRLDLLANNLANITTPGYKQDQPVYEDFQSLFAAQLAQERPYPAAHAVGQYRSLGRIGTGVTMTYVRIDLAPGPFKETRQPLDLAIAGRGMFVVQQGGTIRFTRDGQFHTDRDGFLVTSTGNFVLGGGEPVQLPRTEEVFVSAAGEIFADGALVARLDIVDLPADGRWDKVGFNLFTPRPGSPPLELVEQPSIRQGFLEQSNVDLEVSSAQMLSVLRLYEAAQQMFRMQDETLSRAVNEVGRLT